MNHTLAVLVENRAGVLARVAGMFSRRGYNIDSLAVGTTERKDISRMTIVVQGDDRIIEQVTKQLHKLVEVIKVSDITDEELVDRELVLIKVNCTIAQRAEIMQMVEVFRGKIVDIGKRSITVEATGDKKKLDAIEEALRPYGIREAVRTGQIAMVRGSKSHLE